MTTGKTPSKKTTSSKRTTKSSAKRRRAKPKVRLSNRKVYALSSCIVLVCALALAVSVLLTGPAPEKTTGEQSDVLSAQRKEVKEGRARSERETAPRKEKAQSSQKESGRSGESSEKVTRGGVADFQGGAADSQRAPSSQNVDSSQNKTSTATKKVQESSYNKTAQTATSSVSKTQKKSGEASSTALPPSSTPSSASATSSSTSSSASVSSSSTSATSSTSTSSAPKAVQDPFPQIVPAAPGAQVTFVFDDGGHNLDQLQKFLDLPFPVDIAVLPRLPHSAESARRIRSSGRHQLMLHQPMQALNPAVDPGLGAIRPQMHVQEIMETLRANIAEIGPIAGLNNHEGSAICENEIQIGAVLDEVKAQGIFFLDSRTTAQTRAPQAALERGMEIYQRDIFLDNEKTRENILKELYKGLTIANKKGRVIMIGHVWSADILPAVLTEVYPSLIQKGYRITLVQ